MILEPRIDPVPHIALDPFDPRFDQSAVARRMRARHTTVKRAILDQRLISGVGNIYADEALWRARIHFEQPTADLGPRRAVQLIRSAHEVMAEALEQGGTSFDSLYVDIDGESGYFARSLNVYGRAGQACRRCGTPRRDDHQRPSAAGSVRRLTRPVLGTPGQPPPRRHARQPVSIESSAAPLSCEAVHEPQLIPLPEVQACPEGSQMIRELTRRYGNTMRQLVKFGVVGGSGVLVNMVVTVVMNKLNGGSINAQNILFAIKGTPFNIRFTVLVWIVAFLVANLYNFQLNRWWTFKSSKHAGWWKEFWPFLAVGSVAALVGMFLKIAMTNPSSPFFLPEPHFHEETGLRSREYWSQLIAILITMPINFIVNKLWTFRSVRGHAPVHTDAAEVQAAE